MAGFVDAGNRSWEPNIESHRNSTLTWKRAVGVVPGEGSAAVHLWPSKTLTYAFADSNSATKLRAIFTNAQNLWNDLITDGFKYNEIKLDKCKKMRANCLMIYYNDLGRLSSTVAVPALDANDKDYEGPTMHLSDSSSVGNLDPNVNAAHELGHAWGLYHEHQAKQWWLTSPEDGRPGTTWPPFRGSILHTNRFHCENLKDYDEALQRVQAVNFNEFDRASLCTSRKTAAKYKFSAMEWLPILDTPLSVDAEFDENSLMLYPSGAGAVGDAGPDADNRRPIMTYADGRPIPIKKGPSPADFAKLISLYGADNRGQTELLNSKGSSIAARFSKFRAGIRRSGDTKGGLC